MKKSTLRLMYLLGTLFVLVLVVSTSGYNMEEEKIDSSLGNYNLIIGTQTVGSKYKFTEQTSLVETAEEIRAMGSNLLKFSMHPRYCTENYDLPCNESIQSLLDLATQEPSVKHVLDMDFTYYHIWVYGFTQYSPEPEGQKNDTTQIKFIGGYPDRYRNALYQEIYDLTSYLLTQYSGSGKKFYLGHWEGDWHLRWDYNRNKPADPKTLEGMIAWEKIRQEAIDDAKKNTKFQGVEVYNYIEVNLVTKSMKEPESLTVTNSILDKVNPDYVSYSSYDATNPFTTEPDLNKNLKQALSYIESKLQPKPGLPEGKRVWIGEYGNPAIKYDEEAQNMRSVWTIKTGLEWGTPFILYWEMYNNEIQKETNKQVGYWLISDTGAKQKIWYTHQQFYQQSISFLNDFYYQNDRLPTMEEFRLEALSFDALKIDLSNTKVSKLH